jgi:hypothetical protein
VRRLLLLLGSRLLGSRLLGSLLLGSLLLASLALPATASADSRPGDAAVRRALVLEKTDLTNATKVTTSTGRTERLFLASHQYPAQSTAMEVTLQRLNGLEEHIWSFRLPRSASSIDATGAGRVKATSTRLGGYAAVSVTSRPVGKRHLTTCVPGVGTSATRAVALTGRLLLVTRSSGSHRWGSVGSLTRAFHFSATSRVVWSYNSDACPQPPFRCRSDLQWTAGSGPVSFFGSPIATGDGVDGSRDVQLTASVRRTDILSLGAVSLGLTVNPDASATLQIDSAHGSATIEGAAPPTSFPFACGTGSGSYALNIWDGAWANGPTPLRLPAQVFGAMQVADGPAVGEIQQNVPQG